MSFRLGWRWWGSWSKAHWLLLAPIERLHEKLRGRDFPTVRNYLRVTLCNIHDEFAKRMDAPALAGLLGEQNGCRLLRIATQRDVLRVVSHYGDETLRMPVERLMSKPLAVVPADAFVYRAIGRMQDAPPRSGRRGGQRDRGAVCADLLRLRAGKALRSAMRSSEAQDGL